jgi:hypothetical protein
MRNADVQQPAYPTVDYVLGAIADWINRYRGHFGTGAALGQCSPDDVQQIAHELGLSAGELRELAAKGPGAADLVHKMLLALNVDPDALAKSNAAVMRDLQRLCMNCSHKTQCRHELATGTAAHFRDYCPNAYTLDALFKRQSLPLQH